MRVLRWARWPRSLHWDWRRAPPGVWDWGNWRCSRRSAKRCAPRSTSAAWALKRPARWSCASLRPSPTGPRAWTTTRCWPTRRCNWPAVPTDVPICACPATARCRSPSSTSSSNW